MHYVCACLCVGAAMPHLMFVGASAGDAVHLFRTCGLLCRVTGRLLLVCVLLLWALIHLVCSRGLVCSGTYASSAHECICAGAANNKLCLRLPMCKGRLFISSVRECLRPEYIKSVHSVRVDFGVGVFVHAARACLWKEDAVGTVDTVVGYRWEN
jgi:hypothetical protein